jgi:hypothetical protein
MLYRRGCALNPRTEFSALPSLLEIDFLALGATAKAVTVGDSAVRD